MVTSNGPTNAQVANAMRNVVAEEGWQPRSALLRSWVEEAEKAEEMRTATVRVPCPHCFEPVEIMVNIG
jgi:hypothetical protein